jgi:hypothetical protein
MFSLLVSCPVRYIPEEYISLKKEDELLRATRLIGYFMMLLSIVVHGLSVPALELIHRWRETPPILGME